MRPSYITVGAERGIEIKCKMCMFISIAYVGSMMCIKSGESVRRLSVFVGCKHI